MPYIFEWDPKNETANLNKHGVSFAEATLAFGDPLSVTMLDPNLPTPKSAFWSSTSPEVDVSW